MLVQEAKWARTETLDCQALKAKVACRVSALNSKPKRSYRRKVAVVIKIASFQKFFMIKYDPRSGHSIEM
jgi:hypothetical protein